MRRGRCPHSGCPSDRSQTTRLSELDFRYQPQHIRPPFVKLNNTPADVEVAAQLLAIAVIQYMRERHVAQSACTAGRLVLWSQPSQAACDARLLGPRLQLRHRRDILQLRRLQVAALGRVAHAEDALAHRREVLPVCRRLGSRVELVEPRAAAPQCDSILNTQRSTLLLCRAHACKAFLRHAQLYSKSQGSRCNKFC